MARKYNRYAYVPGGSSPAVSQAIQNAGFQNVGWNPVSVPDAPPVAQQMADQGDDGGGGGGGSPFDTDPGYLAALAAQQAYSQQLDAALRAARQQAIVQFGDPSLAGLAGFELDPLTAAMAQQNTQAGTSTLAQLQKQRDLNQQGIVNSLAAHGIIRSGDLGYRTGQNQQNYGVELYNAQQGVLGNLASLAQQTEDKKMGARQDTVSALTSAYANYVQNPQFWGAVDDGGAKAAANTAATVAPVTQQMARGGPRPQPRLAVKPPPNPFAARTARQTVRAG